MLVMQLSSRLGAAKNCTIVLEELLEWFNRKKLLLKREKLKFYVLVKRVSKKTSPYVICVLGLTIKTNVCWHAHITSIVLKLNKSYVTRKLKETCCHGTLKMIYYALFHSYMY